MKKYITIAALLAAGSALANAETITFQRLLNIMGVREEAMQVLYLRLRRMTRSGFPHRKNWRRMWMFC